MLFNVPDPVLDVVEALLVGDVVDQHDAHGAAVVGGGDGAEPLLASCVPDLQLDLLPIQLYCANLEVNSCKGTSVNLNRVKVYYRDLWFFIWINLKRTDLLWI